MTNFRLPSRLAGFDFGIIAAAILPLVGLIPTFGDGVIKSADAPLHVHRIFAMTTLLQHGELWPRWVSWFHVGYGYPVFNFYPPGVFYLGGLLGLIGIPATVAFALVAAFAWILGSVGTYKLARLFLPGTAALLAAMLWVYAPSRLYEIWHQGSLPQMLSGACVPWLLWGITIAARHPSRRALLAVALPFAGMTLTHQPITLVTGLLVAPASLLIPLLIARRNLKDFLRRFATIISGLMLGVGLCAIFLLPLAAELKYVQSAEEAADVIPYLISNFLKPSEIFAQPLPMDLNDLRFELPTTFGLVGGIFALVGLIALLRRKHYGLAFLLALGLAFVIFMLVEASLPLWQIIPFLAQLRFPARLLRVGAVLIALAGGACILLLPRRWQTVGMAAALVITLVAALPLVYPNQQFVNWHNLSAADEIRMEVAEFNWGTTSYDEFNPIWGDSFGWHTDIDPAPYVDDPLLILPNPLDAIRQWPDLVVEQLDSAEYRVTVATERPVRFKQFYFPGWTATVDGQPVEVYPEDQVGQITLTVPAGEHIVKLAYTGTPIQTIGALVTLFSLALSAFLFWRTRNSPRPDATAEGLGVRVSPPLPDANAEGLGVRVSPDAKSGLGVRISAVTIFAISAFALVNSLIITPHTLWFRHDSSAESPAYMATPVHQVFGGQLELLGYTLDQDTVAPGDLLEITLFWRGRGTVEREYRPVVQFLNLPTDQAWAVSEPLLPGGGSTTLYTEDRFASEHHELRVFDDTPPYAGRIAVRIVDSQTGEPLLLPDGTDRIILDPIIHIAAPTPDLPRTLDYRFGAGLDLRCASVREENNQLLIDLGWHVSAAPAANLVVFVHGLDVNGEIVEQNDSPPLGALYPTSLWRGGQNLVGQHTLPTNPAITQLALGLYNPDEPGRIPLTQNNQPVPDDRVLLELTPAPCRP